MTIKITLQTLTCCTVLLSAGLGLHQANAQLLVLDQSNTVGGLLTAGTLLPGQGVSQVFSPTLRGVDWVRFNLLTPGITTVRLNIYNNYNLNFGLIASTQPVVITNHQLQTVEFRLPTTVRVTPGNLYTAQLVLLSGNSYRMEFSNSNPYRNGFGLNELNSPGGFTVDNVFSEGIIQVPEPSISLFGLGSFFAIWLNRKAGQIGKFK